MSSREALSYSDHTTAEGESGKEGFQLDHRKSGMLREGSVSDGSSGGNKKSNLNIITFYKQTSSCLDL